MTLIEIMIALVILLIVSLALLQTALLGISTNVKNSMRDEAVSIADMRLSLLRGLPFTSTYTHPDLATAGTTTEDVIQRTIRGAAITYTPARIIANINANTKQLTIRVQWTHKGQTFTHNISTILRTQ